MPGRPSGKEVKIGAGGWQGRAVANEEGEFMRSELLECVAEECLMLRGFCYEDV